MSIKNKFKRLIFLPQSVYNYISVLNTRSGEFQIRLQAENRKSIPKARLCKNGNLNLNAESKDSKVVAFPSFRGASLACAA